MRRERNLVRPNDRMGSSRGVIRRGNCGQGNCSGLKGARNRQILHRRNLWLGPLPIPPIESEMQGLWSAQEEKGQQSAYNEEEDK